jgi:tRNA-Thr(GGU) m(6)t(6)A37 methyltransferase TsaA
MEINRSSYNLIPIGQIVNSVNKVQDMPVLGVRSKIEIDANLNDGLLGLEDYSHIIVLSFLHKMPKLTLNELRSFPSGNNELPEQGIFALRGQRTNPISFNVCKINKIASGLIEVDKIDLVSGTPVLDLKPYLPYYDTPNNAIIPNWAQ